MAAQPAEALLAEMAAAEPEAEEFLVWFAHQNCYFNMRFQEFEALASMVGVQSRRDLYVADPPPTAMWESPFVRVRLPGGERAARAICERAVLVKAILKVWGTGADYVEAVENALADSGMASSRRAAVAPPRTFQIRVGAFGRTASMDNKREVMEAIRPLFRGDEVVDLHDPESTVWALEEHAHHNGEKTHLGPREGPPKCVFIAHQVAGGRSLNKKTASGEKAYYGKYDLSQRAVLGPTTLDNQLAFIMANCACACRGHVALEPFMGTGGLMIALSHFEARVYGGEIDVRVVKGWRVAYTKNKAAVRQVAEARRAAKAQAKDDEAAVPVAFGPAELDNALSLRHLVDLGLAPPSLMASTGKAVKPASGHAEDSEDSLDIFTNFMQYSMPLPEVVICDASACPWRRTACGWVDCIVTDPPYGVRAASKKQGRNPDDRPVAIMDRATYIPSKVSYGEDELSRDLLELAATALVDGGRIVFLVPVDLADFLGIERAAERGGGARGTIRDAAMPHGGRVKDPRLVISETSRDPLLLDEARYQDFVPGHSDLELLGASLQILSGGLGRMLVTMRRRPRGSQT